MNYRPRSHGRFPSPFLGNDHPFQPDYRPASQDYPCEWGVPYDNRGPPPPRHNHQFYQPPHGGMPPRYPPPNRYPVQSWLGSTNPQHPPPPPPWNHPQRPPAPRPHMWRGNSSYPRSHSQSRNNNRNENIEFFCETCDRGFKTQDKFSTHVSEHEQCRVKGCHYVAAPKLVKIHYQTQHVTGLADKIWSLESKEDIDKWRLERKKNFPTKLRVAEKEIEEKQKIIRGEVLETQQFGKMYRGRGRGRGRRGRGGGAHQVPQNLRLTPDIKQSTPEVKETSVVGGGLGLLSAMYDSDEDAPQDEEQERSRTVTQYKAGIMQLQD
ncbi:hypothetical protein CAPTEDRAFT_212992 [Capitella teleta]|uniref:C2H2-type domain-containing protein n=1 Tax=Capitella teleta TaxID=283909 RepID=R7TUZ7_CAPTE|nr:hypothetical protein CAPTEDRAFT_212992 [Capitella teleta]|eukprot:ELT94810.1 hypothetical protein CAPTEDRAFT_212992 [Capitella teleta]